MKNFEDCEIVSVYTRQQAIEDGILIKVCDIRWGEIVTPYIATTHIYEDIGFEGAMEIWNEFADWRTHTMPSFPEEDLLFYTGVNGKKVWTIEDGEAFTIMYPEDYLVVTILSTLGLQGIANT